MKSVSYAYHHLPIPGGGYVTGFLYHPKKEGLLYTRTDIGGAYRFDRENQRWISLVDHVTELDASQAYPIAMAVDENDPALLYIACGERHRPTGQLAVSGDYGHTFTVLPMPMYIHGNLSGRGTGERLIVDRTDNRRLWFASQQDGLWVSPDCGHTWVRKERFPETHLTFITQVGSALVVGSAGVKTKNEHNLRGPALYVSCDGGETFAIMPQPQGRMAEGCRIHGLAAQRWSANEKYFYVTFGGNSPRSFIDDLGYSCDSGGNLDGRIVRYPILKDGTLGDMQEMTPVTVSKTQGVGLEHIQPGQMLPFGFSGIAASKKTPGMLIASTICKEDGDSIFLSWDNGESWQQILFDLLEGDIRFRAPYMRPECNAGKSIIHWLSDLKLNPFDDNESWFNTGTGVFRSFDLTKDTRYYTDWSDGMEETVHLNVYGMPSGPVQALDIVGDLGGFAFTDVDKPCPNSFADKDGNRYITCINADFADANPARIVVTARGNWKGYTKGGLILSEDYGMTWRRLPMAFGLTDEIDAALHRIEQPNVNPGWVAMTPDGQNIVWSIAEGIELPASRVIASRDGGETFVKSRIIQLDGTEKTQGGFKAFADRLDNSILYGFGDHSDLYISLDGGVTFIQKQTPENLPPVHFAKIDTANRTEVRGFAGETRRFLMALREHGLWTLEWNDEKDAFTATRLTREGDWVYRAGMGVGREGGDYITEPKAIYCNAIIDGVYGFYRTLDEAKTFVRVNNDRQMFGRISSIDGDCRHFGRFYVATGTNGLLYGQPEE